MNGHVGKIVEVPDRDFLTLINVNIFVGPST